MIYANGLHFIPHHCALLVHVEVHAQLYTRWAEGTDYPTLYALPCLISLILDSMEVQIPTGTG